MTHLGSRVCIAAESVIAGQAEQGEPESASGLGQAEQQRLARLRSPQIEGLVVTAHGDVIAGRGRKRPARTGHEIAPPPSSVAADAGIRATL